MAGTRALRPVRGGHPRPPRGGTRNTEVDVDLLREGVRRVAGELARLDWHDHIDQEFDPAGDVPLPRVRQIAATSGGLARSQWARIATEIIELTDRNPVGASRHSGRLQVEARDLYEGERHMWVCLHAPENAEEWARKRHLELQPDGVLRAGASSPAPTPAPLTAVATGQPVEIAPGDTPPDSGFDAV